MSNTPAPSQNNKYKGIRRRKWGKWVSEIRVPGSSERLWLGSYTTPQAAAVAHDVASYCLRGNSSPQNLNFPLMMLPGGARVGMSPRSVQRAASDAGLAMDARYLQDSKKGGGEEQEEEEDRKRPPDEDEEDEVGSTSNWRGETTSDPWGRPRNEYDGRGYLSISVEDYL